MFHIRRDSHNSKIFFVIVKLVLIDEFVFSGSVIRIPFNWPTIYIKLINKKKRVSFLKAVSPRSRGFSIFNDV